MKICEYKNHDFDNLKYAKPCDIPNLALWLDGNDTSTLLDKDGNVCSNNLDRIESWLDKSENELNAKSFALLTGVEINRPQLRTKIINNLNAVQFQQLGGNKIFAGDYPFETYKATSFYVYKIIGSQQRGRIFSFSSDNDGFNNGFNIHHVFSLASSPVTLQAYGETNEFNPSYVNLEYDAIANFSGTNSPIGWTVASVAWNDKLSNNVLINGATVETVQEEGPTIQGQRGKYTVAAELLRSAIINSAGATGYFSGFIGEIIVYNRVLKDFEIKYINKYLLFKWRGRSIED
jgi:hypothetical protein